MRRLLSLFSALILTLFLSACDTAEERAEEHYQSALALLEQGDVDRAVVELRNVFTFVPAHLEARRQLASVLLNERARPQQAYSQFLRIAEQYPEDLEARIQLSEIAFSAGSWDEMVRHGEKARELDPDNPSVQIISVALDYRSAVEADDSGARSTAVLAAKDLMGLSDSSVILREILLDDHLRKQEFTDALALLDNLTGEFPETPRYWSQRLQVLIAVGDQDAIEAQLVDLVERFPEDNEQKQTLIRYFLARGELDKTETFLRDLVERAPDGDVGSRVDLIRFLIELRSPEAARVEINAAIESAADPVPFILLGTALDFTAGNTEAAITDLEAAIENAEPSDQTNNMKVSLARMLASVGNDVGARSLVEAVLAEDPDQTSALKMSAVWLVEADDTDAGIAALRTALDADPEDPETLTLMANTYLRTGSNDLARDFLALAVEASGNAPAETVRYAQLLIADERFLPAEDVLLPALRIAPTNIELLRTAAQLYLEMDDLGRMQQVIDTLRRIETEPALQLAVQLEAARLNQTSGSDQAISYLEELAGGAEGDIASKILLLRARLSTGDRAGAIELAESIAAEEPDSPAGRLMLASTLSAAGEPQRALELYGELVEEFPDEVGLQVEISTLQARMGDPESARSTINDALVREPTDQRLLWASASFLEIDGDIDAAIEVYEAMYEQDSSNIIVANNLASLLGTHRADDESLNRAWTIARRFRDFDLPVIQDTYGWIAHRRGNSDEALSYLQSAAASLQDDAIVQFHLAEVYFALERNEEALAQYRVALDQAGIGDTRPQILKAQERIVEIENALATTE